MNIEKKYAFLNWCAKILGDSTCQYVPVAEMRNQNAAYDNWYQQNLM